MNGDRRPIAHLVVHDARAGAAIAAELRGLGWSVVEHPTGMHLLAGISGLVLGDRPDRCPDLIVVEDRLRGCAATTLAHGLRELGFLIPMVVVRGGGAAPPAGALVVDAARAPRAIADYARALAPAPAASDGEPWRSAGREPTAPTDLRSA